MTLEELCACYNPEELEKLKDAELDAILSPFYKATRPELVERKSPQPKQEELKVYLSDAKKKALAELEADGVDLSFMKKKFKR